MESIDVTFGSPGVEVVQATDEIPVCALVLLSELPSSEGSERHAEVSALEGEHGLAESSGVAVKGDVDRFAGVLDHVVGDAGEVADQADVDVEGIGGDLPPGFTQITLVDPRTQAKYVQVRMPTVSGPLPFNFDEADATGDRACPDRLFAKRAKRVDQAIDLVTERLIVVAKGQGDELDLLIDQVRAEVGGDDSGSIALACATPAVAAGVGAHLEPIGIRSAPKYPGGVAAGVEALKAFGPRKNLLEG